MQGNIKTDLDKKLKSMEEQIAKMIKGTPIIKLDIRVIKILLV